MSYHVHITRKASSWADATDPALITLPEWEAYVHSDPEMQPADYASTNQEPGSGAAAKEVALPAGRSAWLAYPQPKRVGGYAWFYPEQGGLTVEAPDEEILGKMLAIAHALQARVQGDDGEYFDEASQPFAAATVLPWATTDFRPFQTYASAEAAQPLLAALTQHGIAAQTALDNGEVAFDPSFANNRLLTRFIVKLTLPDFERGRQVLDDLNSEALQHIAPDHYLLGFPDEELFDLLLKPDEWSALDVTLASQLLRQRGRDVSPDTLRLLRHHRVAELAKPASDHKYLVAGGYLFALLGGMFGLLIGYQLYTSRKQLPDGRRVYSYSPTDRGHGLRILVLGVVMFLLLLAARCSSFSG